MTSDDLYLAVRAWLVFAASSVPLTSAQIIRADQSGPRPPLPYMTVRVNLHDERVGHDEEIVNANAQLVTRGNRRGTISLNAFGDGAEAWLGRALAVLRHEAVKALIPTVAIVPNGGALNLTQVVDDRMEPRWQRDFWVHYASVSDPEQLVELGEVQTENEFGLTHNETITV